MVDKYSPRPRPSTLPPDIGQHHCAGQVTSASTSNSSAPCSPVVCKLKPALSQSCASYNDGASLGPGSVTVTADNTSTNVAVAWDGDARVATFAWRGSQEREVRPLSAGVRQGESQGVVVLCAVSLRLPILLVIGSASGSRSGKQRTSADF